MLNFGALTLWWTVSKAHHVSLPQVLFQQGMSPNQERLNQLLDGLDVILTRATWYRKIGRSLGSEVERGRKCMVVPLGFETNG